ncbi:DegV family protein with EDD domain [Mycoplasmopsis mustelae]|uniref:DegV family protein with EDD domain n=1 Tax=Mycoplasmopsis mustelae TaxID=171289 RepID=A0A4R7UCV1_9BACT|nr:DegV family protein [Mycoplasmopsis mustelae]TDV24267.1 DegV family protein with EDD domain [Mycoplasmopsis mustelae]
MNKIAIVVDSSCGLNQNQAKKLGFFYLPLLIEINGQILRDGVDVDDKSLYNIFDLETKSAKTSVTPLGYMSELFKQLSDEFDYIIVFPISQHLSNQFNILKTLQAEFPKLKVVASKQISIGILEQISKFKQFLNETQDIESALKLIENEYKSVEITLIPKYNDFLVKGGRLSSAAAVIAKLAKIVPLIKFEDGKLISVGKGRIFLKTVCQQIKQKFQTNPNLDLVLLTANKQIDSEILAFCESELHICPKISQIPAVLAVHTGPQAIAILVSENLNDILGEYFEI